MGLKEDIKHYFGIDDLYEVFEINNKAKKNEIKKAYHRLSLKHHPDKFQNTNKKIIDDQTVKFQLLAKIHFILSDDEKRAIYDEQGFIEETGNELNWEKYWRTLFPKITKNDIENYLEKYIGSEEEIKDLKNNYTRFEGDLDLISNHLIAYDEERTTNLIKKLIDKEELIDYERFRKTLKLKNKRLKMFAKENLRFEKSNSEKESENNLIAAIQLNREKKKSNFDHLISDLEKKYCTQKNKNKKIKK